MSFLKDYAILTSGNECPRVFHNWAGLSALSSICSRRVWTDLDLFTVHTNMYILFVGMPGSKKSTGMKIAEKLISGLKDIPISPDSITKEALTEQMGKTEESPFQLGFAYNDALVKYTHVSMFCNEFATMLEAGGNSVGMVSFLTDVWDKDEFKVATKNKGVDDIPKPYVTLLGCLTTETMNNMANQKIITSGFSRRCIFVHSNDFAPPIAFPTITAEQIAAKERLYKRAREIQKLKGPFTWTEEARAWYKSWYDKHHAAMVQEKNVVFQGYLQSKAGYVIKLAMLITLSDSDELVLHEYSLEIALAFIDTIEPDMMKVFEGSGRNEKAPVVAAIKRLIEASDKPVPVKAILRTFYNDVGSEDDLRGILNHLSSTEQIKMFPVDVNGVQIHFVQSLELSKKKLTSDQQS